MGILDGKVAAIVGAGRGIGRAVARLFASEGARVVVADVGCDRDGAGRDPEVARAVVAEIVAAGGEAVAHTEGCTTGAEAERVLAAAFDAFGRLDTVVHAAGHAGDQVLVRADDEIWERTLRTHLGGAFALTRAAARVLSRGGGRIVLTTGTAGFLGNHGQAAYSAAAAGIHGLMRTASIELQRSGVFVNAVAPLARTRLTEDLPMFEHVTTMGPEHVAPAYLFLGSDLSKDLTGNVLSIAGGRISTLRMVESPGRFKEGDDRTWTAAEIADEWSSMTRS